MKLYLNLIIASASAKDCNDPPVDGGYRANLEHIDSSSKYNLRNDNIRYSDTFKADLPSACKKVCHSVQGCLGWIHSVSAQTCWMRSNMFEKTWKNRCPGYTAGFKDQCNGGKYFGKNSMIYFNRVDGNKYFTDSRMVTEHLAEQNIKTSPTSEFFECDECNDKDCRPCGRNINENVLMRCKNGKKKFYKFNLSSFEREEMKLEFHNYAEKLFGPIRDCQSMRITGLKTKIVLKEAQHNAYFTSSKLVKEYLKNAGVQSAIKKIPNGVDCLKCGVNQKLNSLMRCYNGVWKVSMFENWDFDGNYLIATTRDIVHFKKGDFGRRTDIDPKNFSKLFHKITQQKP